jgi:hypothetical protein
MTHFVPSQNFTGSHKQGTVGGSVGSVSRSTLSVKRRPSSGERSVGHVGGEVHV